MAPTGQEGKQEERTIVISGPSGSGKSTIINKKLFGEFPDKFGFGVSHTTRSPRAGESPGESYHYITRDEFEKMIADGGFIEHAQFGGNYYGTSYATVDDIARQGKRCILDIEMEGVKQIAKSHLKAKFLFLSPPSPEVLEQRLRGRQTDSEEAIQKRLTQAVREMEFARSGEAPHEKIVVNDDLDRAYEEVKEFCLSP
ncbi:guanylate kinase-like protein [Aulographum hederae CBS 113979]|uniref:Guanylate kinase n=1 Tax=Aulographum hederae CBS 113979 TaxID=1176131 RepID=A0A6G1H4L2_9PEZI|nr:guanylate kinase-like protein [Aulographum hederae CBS 113979]